MKSKIHEYLDPIIAMSKKNYLFFALFFAVSGLHAQVPNGSFEQFIGYGNETRYWGANPLLIPITINLDGTTVTDQVEFAPNCSSTCFYSNDAFEGNRAMEIRNAHNVTQNQSIPGKMILFNELEGSTTASGWNAGFPITADCTLERLGFYYKFFPVNNDRAHARIEIFDDNGESIGSTTTQITGTHANYTYVYSYLYLAYNKTPAFMRVEFYMSNPSGVTSLGSRFVVDQVVTSAAALGINQTTAATAFEVYPTVASDQINVVPPAGLQGNINYRVVNMDGKTVKQANESAQSYVYAMDVSELATGMYLLQIESDSQTATKKFVKK